MRVLKLLKKLPIFLLRFVKAIPRAFIKGLKFIPFFLLVAISLLSQPIRGLFSRFPFSLLGRPLAAPVSKLEEKVIRFLDHARPEQMISLDLIVLAMSHLRAKKARTFITIGGITIGFGSVILLLSLGYGFQRLVISRVATLGEMQQIDVSIGQASNLKFNDSTIQSLKDIESVDAVLPVVSTVSKIQFNNSVSDVVAYGVTTRFLEESALQPTRGSFFENEIYEPTFHENKNPDQPNESSENNTNDDEPAEDNGQVTSEETEAKVQGASTYVYYGANYASQIGKLDYSIFPYVWKPVYEEPNKTSKIIGFTKRAITPQNAQEYWGAYYINEAEKLEGTDSAGNRFSPWVGDSFLLWTKEDCDIESFDCIDGIYVSQRKDNRQYRTFGYITNDQVSYKRYKNFIEMSNENVYGEVLGEATSTESSQAEQVNNAQTIQPGGAVLAEGVEILGLLEQPELLGDDLDWEAIAQQAGIVQQTFDNEILPFGQNAKKVAVVNSSMLTILGLQPADALDKEFEISYLLDGTFFNRDNYSAESEIATYRIIGVLPDDRTPAIYVPFGDLQGLGVINYSQLKMIANDTEDVAGIRKKVEDMGFRTTSIVDTVENINNLFAMLRVGLLVLGLVALGVAALGMFNTLTVSLLEKTREVGLMKAMGMKSTEVEKLFLAESVIMSVSGGTFGLIFGYITGSSISLILTSIALASGSDPINVSYIPFGLVVSVMTFSFVLGIITGWYPSRRATTVSALNALRYE